MLNKKRSATSLLISVPLIIITTILVIYILKLGKDLITPFIIALLLSFAIIGLMNFYKRIKIPGFISFILSIGTYILLFWVFGKMLGSSIDDIISKVPAYQKTIVDIVTSVFQYFGLQEPQGINDLISRADLSTSIKTSVKEIASVFGKAGIIIFYIIFILLEYRYFGKKLVLMIKDDFSRSRVVQVLNKIRRDVKSYFVIKAFVSCITAILSYLIMKLFGLDFAVFWALLIFFLNFIPSIGSIIAVSFPGLFSLVQFYGVKVLLWNTFYIEGYYIFAIMFSGLVGVQVLMGNIFEPRFVGNKLNISPLVIILALGFWGNIWGIVGMLLSVPIMVIINIILAKIPATRSVAILLSERGELEIEANDDVVESRRKLLEKVKKRLKVEKKLKKIKTKTKKA